MRFVHLARASTERTIRKGGLKGAKAIVPTSAKTSIALARAVYAMPVVADFWTTFQWLRELRRSHGERLVAVYFRVPDDEPVHCGRYSEPHVVRTAAAAAAWVLKNPAGAQVVVPRSIAAREVVSIKGMKQLVGWTEIPEASKKSACVCWACLAQGDRHLMRRVRGAFAAGLTAARRASSDDELRAALGRLEVPLERGRDRLDHAKLVRFARAASPEIRRSAARLFGYFGFSKIQGHLRVLLDDPELEVRHEAVEALVRAGGAVRASKLLASCGPEAISHLVELLGYEANELVVLETLEKFVNHPDREVRATVARVARALRPDFDGSAASRRRLGKLASAR